MINALSKEVHKNAIAKGFYEDGKAQNMGERIALIHAEASEALEADRKGKYCNDVDIIELNNIDEDSEFIREYNEKVKGTFQEEIADIVIRCFDMNVYKSLDLENHILAKMRFNSHREKYHGKKY